MNLPDPKPGPDVDFDSDQDIDRVLAALNAVEPAPGMQARVHAQLHAASVAKPRRFGRPVWALASGLAMLPLVLTLVVVHRRSHPAASASNSLLLSPVTRPSLAMPSIVPARLGAAHPGAAASVSAAHTRRAGVAVNPQLSAADEPSFPAPPVPLTAQERLLCLAARHGELAETPTLDPGQLAEQEARSEAEFQERSTQLPGAELVATRRVDVEDLTPTPISNGVHP